MPISSRKGQSLAELLVAVAIGTIMITAAVSVIVPALKGNTTVTRNQTAIALGKELRENIQVWSEAGWGSIHSLSTTSLNHYHLHATSSPFTAIVTDQTITVSTTTYTRYFFVDDVARDAGGAIVTSGGTNDPSTKKITVVYGVSSGPTSTFVSYITRSGNRVYVGTDWSGGSGVEGPATTTGSTFATSSNLNVATTTGSLILTGF